MSGIHDNPHVKEIQGLAGKVNLFWNKGIYFLNLNPGWEPLASISHSSQIATIYNSEASVVLTGAHPSIYAAENPPSWIEKAPYKGAISQTHDLQREEFRQYLQKAGVL